MLTVDNITNTKDLVDVSKVKIKKEKLTPPPSPKDPNDFDITNDMLDSLLGDRKPIAEPIKSSNEILADLFKVFNAAPPTLDDDGADANIREGKSRKKHKKEKKSKKHKKRNRSDESTDSGNDEKPKSKKVKKEKSNKSEKKHKKSKSKERNTNKDDIVIKKEKCDTTETAVKVKKVNDPIDGSKENGSNDSKSVSEKKSPLGITVSLTKDNDGTTSKRQIVIKNLVNSEVYQNTIKEVEARLKEKEKEKVRKKNREKEKDREKRKKHRSRSKDKHNHRESRRSHSSSLSLSDEETYLREREHYYRVNGRNCSSFVFF